MARIRSHPQPRGGTGSPPFRPARRAHGRRREDARTHRCGHPCPEHRDDLGRGATLDPRRIVEHRHPRAPPTEAPIRVRDGQTQPFELAGEDRRVTRESHGIVGRGPAARADEHHAAEFECIVLECVASVRKRPPNLRHARPPPVVIAPENQLHPRPRSDPQEIAASLLQIARPGQVSGNENRVAGCHRGIPRGGHPFRVVLPQRTENVHRLGS